MREIRRTEKIKACVAILIIVLAILTTGIIALKYQVEGEVNIPFKLLKITIVSTAEGVQNEGAQEKWNLSIFQNNDIYFTIEKHGNKEDIIKSISIENIQISKTPQIGEIKAYMPNSSDGRLFTYNENMVIKEGKLTYKGATKSNSKTLEIGNQGGTTVIRLSNTNIGEYISNDDNEIKHDGSLLSKVGLTQEQVSFEVTFDFVINLENTSYKSTITLQLPSEGNLIENGTCSKEITDGFIFKRITK